METKFYVFVVASEDRARRDPVGSKNRLDRCRAEKCCFIDKKDIYKGSYDKIEVNDILLLRYKWYLVAYGKVKSPAHTVGDEYLIDVEEWYWNHANDLQYNTGSKTRENVVEKVQNIKIKEFNNDKWLIEDVIPGIDKNTMLYDELKSEYDKANSEKAHNETDSDDIAICGKLLEKKKNIILQGAPGTGKTYNTAAIALKVLGITNVDMKDHKAVMERYKSLLPKSNSKEELGDGRKNVEDNPRIFFTTFHQSLDYEDFVEGMRPKLEGNNVSYDIEDGIFMQACKAAKEQSVVLILDEINRGNVSKIFGELITLIEADKRDKRNLQNNDHPIEVTLPYSKKTFSVPSTLYIIGTMNTTDRSTGTLDYALRRRFAFYTLKSDVRVVKNSYSDKGLGDRVVNLFENVKEFIAEHSSGDYSIDDLMVGHSYFMAEDEDELRDKIEYEVIPLIKEYINDGILNVEKGEEDEAIKEWRRLNTVVVKKDRQKTVESKAVTDVNAPVNGTSDASQLNTESNG